MFNVTTKDKEDIRTWMIGSGVEVMDIELLSKDNSDRLILICSGSKYIIRTRIRFSTVASGLSPWDADITSIRRKWILV